MYRVFNVAIDSSLALPELPELSGPGGMPVLRFALGAKGRDAAEQAGVEWFHDWTDPQGNVTVRAGRTDGHHWLRFPDLADFAIDLVEQSITAYPEPDTDEATLRHLLLDQVMPRVLGQQGELVLHAGAVTLQNGVTLAFVGETGSGKSTLVSSLERNGARLMTDDCVQVLLGGDVPRVVPSYSGVRLLDDSLHAIYGTRQATSEMAQYTGKRRVCVSSDRNGNDEVMLDALFLLGEPARANGAGVELRPAGGSTALMAIVSQIFLLDISDRLLLKKQFEGAGELLRCGLPCYTLNYARDHDRLGELRTVIEEAVA